jgi:cell division protein FtsN
MAAKDYKSRAHPPRKPQKQQRPGWVWFISGMLVGVFISGLIWLKVAPSGPVFPQSPRTAKQEPPKPATEKKKEDKQPDTPKPRFDFYTILPEMEVVVPDPIDEPESRATVAAEATEPAVRSAASSSGGYMLQMGSFRNYADADRLKASLALVGIQAEIQKVNIKGGHIYHRVRSGPYDKAQVNSLRAKLKEKKISSLVIKYRK